MELQETLQNLEEAKKIMMGVDFMISVRYLEKEQGIEARSTKFDGKDFLKARAVMERAIVSQDYQMIWN